MLLSGHLRLRKRHLRRPSWALAPDPALPLARLMAAPVGAPPGNSGCRLLATGQDAYLARLGLADRAMQSLDIQYFLWDDDSVGRVLLERLMAAAERGVRVRLLIDDIHTAGRDRHLVRLDALPGVEVRVFNPFGSRDWPVLRALDLLRDFRRLNHRMHNKAWLADNAAAIVGGRNIAEHYFGLNQDSNFRDLDVLLAGPAVQELSAAFDAYWNSAWARPIAELTLLRSSPRRARRYRRRLSRRIARMRGFPYPIRWAQAFDAELRRDLVWAPVRVVHDGPDKVGDAGGPSAVWTALHALFGAVRHECLLESAYFVPTPESLAAFAAMRAQGVSLRALTNSLGSTDVIAAHAGYARWRMRILAAGIALHELRPLRPRRRLGLPRRRSRSRSALHAKAALLDGSRVLIGSFNLDSRSEALNTELMVVIDSAILGQRLRAVLDAGVAPEHAWRLRREGGGLVWESGGETERGEPQAGWWRRLVANVLSRLPMDSQL